MFSDPKKIAVYVHWPFCKSKCPYCDFNSHVRDAISHDDWSAAYVKELDSYSEILRGREVTSIFFGGGTPSLAEPQTFAAIIEKLGQLAELNDPEITIEANPTSVEAQKFKQFRQAGVNRVSLGIQSLNPDDLKFLGREHSAEEAKKAIEIARSNFERYSFDLIYALPQQSMSRWEKELQDALSLVDDHMSLYQLTIEKGTQFFADNRAGKFVMPSQDLAADFYELTQSIMQAHGLPAYEVSNHAKPSFECKHNLTYWEYGDYIGIGPGAHGRYTFEGKKYATVKHHLPEKWLHKIQEQGSANQSKVIIPPQEAKEEMIMMGLRLKSGLAAELLDPNKVAEMIDDGLLEKSHDKVRATASGMLVLNSITEALLA